MWVNIGYTLFGCKILPSWFRQFQHCPCLFSSYEERFWNHTVWVVCDKLLVLWAPTKDSPSINNFLEIFGITRYNRIWRTDAENRGLECAHCPERGEGTRSLPRLGFHPKSNIVSWPGNLSPVMWTVSPREHLEEVVLLLPFCRICRTVWTLCLSRSVLRQ